MLIAVFKVLVSLIPLTHTLKKLVDYKKHVQVDLYTTG